MPRRVRQTVATVLPCLVLAFIFTQSLLPPALSGAESSRVAALIARILGADSLLGRILIAYVRKLAHMFEYAVLSVTVVYLVHSAPWAGTHLVRMCAPLFGTAVGLIDELLIQHLSGRGAALTDVLIDTGGYLIGYIAACLLADLIARRRARRTPMPDA